MVEILNCVDAFFSDGLTKKLNLVSSIIIVSPRATNFIRILCFAVITLTLYGINAKELTVTSNSSRSTSPKVGAVVHTLYTSVDNFHWKWYQSSAAYWESGDRPNLGWYDQSIGTSVQEAHYAQLRRARINFALFSWYDKRNGDPADPKIDIILSNYWKVFSEANGATAETPIELAILMEGPTTNYRERIDYLQDEYYRKHSKYALRFNDKPVIALGSSNASNAALEDVIEYAEQRGFYVVSGNDAKGGGAAFVGVTMKEDGPNRITRRIAIVSPGSDVSGRADVDGKALIFDQHQRKVGCAPPTRDIANCGSFETTASVNPVAQYLTEWYAIFALSGNSSNEADGSAVVADSCGHEFAAPINRALFKPRRERVLVAMHFRHPNAACIVSLRLQVSQGTLLLDRI